MGNFRTVEYLVSALCKLEGKTVNGFTALHFAVAYRRYEIVEYLLQNGVKIHAKSNTGISPMAVAIEQRNAAMVKILVEYGYKFDKRYKWKETPLNQAINLYSEECAMTLVHQGCSLAKKRGHSYFYMAVDEKLTRLFKFLAAVNPQYLQEPWIRSQNWPISIYHRPNIMKWLEQESNQVRTLRQLCRGKVFRSLGKYPTTKLKELNLPPALVNYVSYTSHVKDEMFERKVLDVKIHCPSECPSLCSKRYCPPIEFLYSSDEESDTSVDDDLVTVKHDSNIQEEQYHS